MPDAWPDFIEFIVRGFIAYFTLFIMARFMGKREIAQLTYFDYIVGITIGSLTANVTLNQSISFWHGLITLVLFASLQVITAVVAFQSRKVRKVIDGERTLLIEQGQIRDKNLKKERLNIDELNMMLRTQNVFKLADVEFAYLEPNGQVSVQKKPSKQPVTPNDLQINPSSSGKGHLVIEQGKILTDVIHQMKITEAWLISEINKQGYDLQDVCYVQIDDQNNLYVDLNDQDSQ
jgi:uncharacterized membrane protein YcaP (DUF421 family)